MKALKLFLTLIIVSLLLLSCQQANNNHRLAILPMQAIEQSALQAPKPVAGIFELKVKSTDFQQRLEFLNSEIDHQDQRNLIIAIRPNAVKELTDLHGQTPRDFFLNKRIRVKGEAKRQKIWILYKNKNTRKYYYQTKIFVKSASQISLISSI